MPASSDESPAEARPWRSSAGLLAALALTGLGAYVAMRLAGQACTGQSVAWATLAVAVALVPPLWLDSLLGPTVAGPLATVAWRLGVLLPTVVLVNRCVEPARNCALVTLLACYLMTLPLESWLLIRQAPANHQSRRSRALPGSDQDKTTVR